MSKSILIVDDEQILRESLGSLLESEGYETLLAGDGRAAHDIALERPVDLVLSDLRMPELDGIALLERLMQLAPQTPVIIMTAYGTVDTAVDAMRMGAWDYLLKPVQFDDLLLKIKRALEYREITRDRQILTDQLAEESTFHNVVSESPVMLRLFDQVRKLSAVKSNVLLTGASGTGKELFARAIHYNGVTRAKPFVPINCGGIPSALINSELFGHRRGSFTGAVKDKIGYFEVANGGTVFLDEISSLPLDVQSTLLRVLEDRLVIPVGDTHPRPVDVRVIAASNVDLEAMVAKGEFREDLLYRLNVVHLTLPTLAERKCDIPLLTHHFITKFCQQMNKSAVGVTNGAMRSLLSHQWRGNVRELQNVIERAIIFVEGDMIRVEDLPFESNGAGSDDDEDLKESMRQFEKQHIISCLRSHNFDKPETAKHLGIGVSSLYRKLEELGIPKQIDQPDSTSPDQA